MKPSYLKCLLVYLATPYMYSFIWSFLAIFFGDYTSLSFFENLLGMLQFGLIGMVFMSPVSLLLSLICYGLGRIFNIKIVFFIMTLVTFFTLSCVFFFGGISSLSRGQIISTLILFITFGTLLSVLIFSIVFRPFKKDVKELTE